MSATVPPLIGAEHELPPLYVPLIAMLLMLEVPEIESSQVGNAETPPRGTTIVQVSVEPLSVPVTLPVNVTVPSAVEATTDPETAAPLWLNIHVICPGPDESDAVPDHVPCTDVCVDGVDGVEEFVLLPQAANIKPNTGNNRLYLLIVG